MPPANTHCKNCLRPEKSNCAETRQREPIPLCPRAEKALKCAKNKGFWEIKKLRVASPVHYGKIYNNAYLGDEKRSIFSVDFSLYIWYNKGKKGREK